MPVLSSEPRHPGNCCYAQVYIPLGPLITAWEFLRANGEQGREQLCFLAGRTVTSESGTAAQVTSCVLPVTAATSSYVTLTDHTQTALILDALEGRDEVPLMSLHTHGGGGADGCGLAHSQVDDAGVALSSEEGVFSAVIGHYAHGSALEFPRHSAIYERLGDGWRRLLPDERDARVIVYSETLRLVPARDHRKRRGER